VLDSSVSFLRIHGAHRSKQKRKDKCAIAAAVPTAATIADADPQVTCAVRLAQWVGLGVTPRMSGTCGGK
jgi:hypothetical protein